MKSIWVMFLFLFSNQLMAQDRCAYLSKPSADNLYPGWQVYDNCASHQKGLLNISAYHMGQIDFSDSDLAPFWFQGQHYYVKPDRSYLAVLSYDNGADYFSEGLVRSIKDGKIVYSNSILETVIPAKYEWGWPFEKGRALVCSGCALQAKDDMGHQSIVGGLWGYIDKEGREVVPVNNSQVEVREK